ncbi:hypothetical protein PFISCL1PPCAC_1128 [Pristionchus fissidentatus]|uniref:Uncharacterized protein n=2 Tax=Pristionchus fissidentatus TaxID=1538716 RepID=A0AAV5UTK5_9BILA|nr:hypothetical protein PFISCL1PPCAC_1128 [Pristionchus fissidentatus]
MSIIFKIDNEYHVLNRDVVKRGSITLCGEKCVIDFFGVHREDAVYCEEGTRKALLKEVQKWESGEKTVDNQSKPSLSKLVIMAGGERVEVNQRAKRTSTKRIQFDASPAQMKKSRASSVGREQRKGEKGASVDTPHLQIKQ